MDKRFDCPSAQPEMDDARPFGVLSGTPKEARIAFFKKDAAESLDWRQLTDRANATHVLRFAAGCEQSGCSHYDGHACQLGQRVARQLEPVVDSLPSCLIRNTCRWHAERGDDVCLRCPQVVTMAQPSSALAGIAVSMPTNDHAFHGPG